MQTETAESRLARLQRQREVRGVALPGEPVRAAIPPAVLSQIAGAVERSGWRPGTEPATKGAA